jgi:hypothetical protein
MRGNDTPATRCGAVRVLKISGWVRAPRMRGEGGSEGLVRTVRDVCVGCALELESGTTPTAAGIRSAPRYVHPDHAPPSTARARTTCAGARLPVATIPASPPLWPGPGAP